MMNRPLLFIFAGVMLATLAHAQLSVRDHDPSGLSNRLPRIRVIHSDTPNVPGASMHLQMSDPWLAFKMGGAIFSHEWTRQDAVFGAFLSRPLAEGITNSCGMCHSNPPRTPGAGPTVAEPGSFGRSVPPLFGIGLFETIAQQIRQQILAKYDTNHNGFLDVPAETAGRNAIIEATPGVMIDFGPLDDRTASGFPSLNDIVQIFFVDQRGRPVISKDRVSLKTPGVAGYDIAVAAITSSLIIDQQPSVRMFVTNAMRAVLGLRVSDHTISNNSGTGRDEKAGDVWAETSNAGARQPYSALPSSHSSEAVSEGEVDLLEWFLLNYPRPGLAKQNARTRRGHDLLQSVGCTSCHTEKWQIQPFNAATGMSGDRRFFDLEVNGETADGHLQGRIQLLTRKVRGPDGAELVLPRRDGFLVDGIYSDFRYHDLGDKFYEYRYVNKQLIATHRFRTPPLWGAGSTAPYGHDGRSLTLDDVIRRHGGEADSATSAYLALAPADRDALLAYLKSLVLFQPDQLPCDVNGDGKIDAHYRTRNGDAGPERCEPELLFKTPPRYRGWVTGPDGDRFFSYELLNAREAYGRNLPALIDSDGDGIPDLLSSQENAQSQPEVARLPKP